MIMGKYDDLKNEIKALVKTGEKLIKGINAYDRIVLGKEVEDEEKTNDLAYYFIYNYEQWYSAAFRININSSS